MRLVSAGAEIRTSDTQRLLSLSPDSLRNVSQPQHQLPIDFAESVLTDDGTYTFTGKKWESASSSGQSQAASLVFLHGFLGHAADWDTIAAALSLDRDCFAFNLPGHGGSHFQSALSKENGSSAHTTGKYLVFLPFTLTQKDPPQSKV